MRLAFCGVRPRVLPSSGHWYALRTRGELILVLLSALLTGPHTRKHRVGAVMPPNDRTERRGRPTASALPTDVARPRSL
jgi:hypothetical protein